MIVTDITGIGDPQILLYEDTYYCYATGCKDGFYVWKSSDLVTWSKPIVCMHAGEDHWGCDCFWAPEVVYHNGKFVMHYTARRRSDRSLRLGVAVSDSPEGPFVDVHGKPMFDLGYATIDGSVLRYKGKNYFYYSRDCSENYVDGVKTSQVWCVELNETLTETVGEHVLMTTPTHEWERLSMNIAHLWNEGPCVIEHDGRLVMNFSANHYASNEYSICIATATEPMGPWVKEDAANPVLRARDGLFGAGHNAFFCAKDGTLMTSFHVQTTPENPSGNRRTVIGKVGFEERDGVLYQTIE